MKKQIGLITFTALLLTFVAFSGVVSAQPSDVKVVMFTSPMCAVCKTVHPLVQNAVAKTGAKETDLDVSDATNKGIAQANSVTETPTLIFTGPGGQSKRLEGSVSQDEIEKAIQEVAGKSVPSLQNQVSTVKTNAQPPVKPVVAIAKKVTPQVPVAVVAKKVTPVTQTKTSTSTSSSTAKAPVAQTTISTATAPQPNIQVSQPQVQTQSTATQPSSTQTVPEFSLLGLGAPALIVGAIYLFMRRK